MAALSVWNLMLTFNGAALPFRLTLFKLAETLAKVNTLTQCLSPVAISLFRRRSLHSENLEGLTWFDEGLQFPFGNS